MHGNALEYIIKDIKEKDFMMTVYPDNPYYNLLVLFLIKYQLTEVKFKKELFFTLDVTARDELKSITGRNKRLARLEQYKPGFVDKKPLDAGEYQRLQNENAELINSQKKNTNTF